MATYVINEYLDLLSCFPETVFFCFQGISVLIIDKTTEVVTNIIDRHKIILNCLGKPYWEFYS